MTITEYHIPVRVLLLFLLLFALPTPPTTATRRETVFYRYERTDNIRVTLRWEVDRSAIRILRANVGNPNLKTLRVFVVKIERDLRLARDSQTASSAAEHTRLSVFCYRLNLIVNFCFVFCSTICCC